MGKNLAGGSYGKGAEEKMTKPNWKETMPKIVAVDFDGTLVKDAYPNVGEPIWSMINYCKALRKVGVKLILWTSRDNETPDRALDRAVNWCKDNGLEFDAVNENLPELKEIFQNDTRKVYADLYIDDKAVFAGQHPFYWLHRIGLSWDALVKEFYGLRK